jgi:hypothetical protein
MQQQIADAANRASEPSGPKRKWKKMKTAVKLRGTLEATRRKSNAAGKDRRESKAKHAGEGMAKWKKMRAAVTVTGAVKDELEEEDDFLKSIKSMYDDEKQSVLGVRVGRTQQALVVKLSDDRSLKRALASMKNAENGGIMPPAHEEDDAPCFCALPLIHPFGQHLMVWQVALVVMIVFNMIFVPYEITFKDCAQSPATSVLNDISDAFFIIDIIVQMHVMLVIEEKHKDRTLLVDDRAIIAKEYIRAQFWVDVLSIGPPFGSHYLGEEGPLSFVSVLKCLKLFRIMKAAKILANVIHVKADYVQIFNVVKMIMLICYSSHVIGCMFSGVARLSDMESNWVVAKGFSTECADSGSPMEEYVAAYYWAVMTLTTVGYGDVSAQNKYEMIFSSVVMVAGAIFYALVLGSVTSAIQELSSGDQALLLKMKTVDKFIARYNLNSTFSKRLKQATRLQGEWNHEMFEEMLSACHPEFRAELLMAIHRPILIKTSFFKGIDEAFLKLIVGELKMHVCLENDCVYRGGDDGECMFLLNQGFVGIYSNELETRMSLLEPGDVFGEGAVLSRAFSKRMETAVAEVRSVIHSLGRDSIHDAAAAFPNVQKLMETRVVALITQRDNNEKALVSKEHADNEGNEGIYKGTGKDTLTVDVFQANNLPGATDIIHANIFVRCFLFSRCARCEQTMRRGDNPTDLMAGDKCRISKEGHHEGKIATVVEVNWMNSGRVQVKMADGELKSYLSSEVALFTQTQVNVSPPAAKRVVSAKTMRKQSSSAGSSSKKVHIGAEDGGEKKEDGGERKEDGGEKKDEKRKSITSYAAVSMMAHMPTLHHMHHAHKPAPASSNLLDFGVYSCADCTVNKKATAPHAQTFDPEWNEKFEFALPNGQEAQLFVAVYQKALIPILLGFVEVTKKDMREGHAKVDWFDMRRLHRQQKKQKTVSGAKLVSIEAKSNSRTAHFEPVSGKLQLRVERVSLHHAKRASMGGAEGKDARSQLLEEIMQSPKTASTKARNVAQVVAVDAPDPAEKSVARRSSFMSSKCKSNVIRSSVNFDFHPRNPPIITTNHTQKHHTSISGATKTNNHQKQPKTPTITT